MMGVRMRLMIVSFTCGMMAISSLSFAVSPAAVERGRSLFSTPWTKVNPIAGRDGLGPLFNANSCATCHNQGGIGGGGDSRFNAHSISIESIEVHGKGDEETLRAAIRKLHPGFAPPGSSLMSTVVIPHFGGSSATQNLRGYLEGAVDVSHAEEGGFSTASDTRRSGRTSFKWDTEHRGLKVRLTLRVFERNTTSTIGTGVIERIPAKFIMAAAKAQLADGEVSGRPSVLTDGSLGRFGWRANRSTLRDFVEQACVAEMGLQTKGTRQLADPADVRDLSHDGEDITEFQIDEMTIFLTTLGSGSAGEEAGLPDDVLKGKQNFISVGCAKCHIPNLGPATGIYSDILLHDMGPKLYDYTAAEPYVLTSATVPITRVLSDTTTRNTTRTGGGMSPEYYGRSMPLDFSRNDTISHLSRPGKLVSLPRNASVSAVIPTARMSPSSEVLPLPMEITRSRTSAEETSSQDDGIGGTITTRQRRRVVTQTTYELQREIKPTYVTQEWRTPPLWDVGSTAPYMHDGRATTLLEAIAMHGGESETSRKRFMAMSIQDRMAVISFLESLVAAP